MLTPSLLECTTPLDCEDAGRLNGRVASQRNHGSFGVLEFEHE